MNTQKYLASDGYYHYVYKITFNSTGQYYIGQHSVLSSEISKDKYMGSGKILNEYYELSGFQDVSKTICCYAESFDALDFLEKDLIGDKWKTDPLCLNMISGGRSSGRRESRALGGINAQKRNKEKGFSPYASWWNSLSDNEKKDYCLTHPIPKNFRCDWTGRKHKPETIEKMRGPNDKIRGKNNGNFGNHWIYHPEFKISICVPEIMFWDYIAEGWIKGRIMSLSEAAKNKIFENAKKFKGSKRITNGIKDCYVKDLTNIPDGFYVGSKLKGKTISAKAKNTRIQNHEKLKAKKYVELKPMLEVYEKFGFDEVVKQFNYKYTRNNLVQSFKAYIPEYVPNKHTRNTKAKQFQLT